MKSCRLRFDLRWRTWPRSYWLWLAFAVLVALGPVTESLSRKTAPAKPNPLDTAGLESFLSARAYKPGPYWPPDPGLFETINSDALTYHKEMGSSVIEVSIPRKKAVTITILDKEEPYPPYRPLSKGLDLERTQAAIRTLLATPEVSAILNIVCRKKVAIADVIGRQREKLKRLSQGLEQVDQWEHVWKGPYDVRTESRFLPLALGISCF
ncbi:MAG: hypothetical protein PVG03_14975 [Desulfarculaceae bacterium]|jgi:hypothetical protein